MALGRTAFDPWLMELPWCSHTLRPLLRAGSTGASVRRAINSVTSVCGSQISMPLSPAGRPVNRAVPAGPSVSSAVWLTMSVTVRTLPPATVARAARRPSTSRSYTPSGGGGNPL